MKTSLRIVGLALTALTVISTTACTAPSIETATGTVTRYRADTDWGSQQSGYFELKGQNAIYYCPTYREQKCLTVRDDDSVSLQYYVNSHNLRIITSLTRQE